MNIKISEKVKKFREKLPDNLRSQFDNLVEEISPKNPSNSERPRRNLYRYKKDGQLYLLYYRNMPIPGLDAEPFFPGVGILARKRKVSIREEDFEIVARLP